MAETSRYAPCFGERGVVRHIAGKLQCHICGLAFHGLAQHVLGRHGISPDEYRREFGLHRKLGLVSDTLHGRMMRRPQVLSPRPERLTPSIEALDIAAYVVSCQSCGRPVCSRQLVGPKICADKRCRSAMVTRSHSGVAESSRGVRRGPLSQGTRARMSVAITRHHASQDYRQRVSELAKSRNPDHLRALAVAQRRSVESACADCGRAFHCRPSEQSRLKRCPNCRGTHPSVASTCIDCGSIYRTTPSMSTKRKRCDDCKTRHRFESSNHRALIRARAAVEGLTESALYWREKQSGEPS